MSKDCLAIRYAYVKNGDVVTQLERMEAAPERISSGPDAFLSDFLRRSATGPVLLISRSNRSARHSADSVDARVFRDGIGLLDKLWRRPWVSLRIFANVVRFRPDRIVCSSSGGGVMWASFAAARYLSVPFVHSRHNRVIHEDEPWHRRLRSWIDGWFIKHSDRVICHGPFLRQQLVELGVPERNVFEFDVRFDDLLAARALERPRRGASPPPVQSSKTILYIGRVEARKGVADLLEASLAPMRNDPSVCLVYCGVGAHLAALRAIAERSEFADRVEVLGELPHHEMAARIADSEVVVAPTRRGFPEGRCMAVMEAMLVGVPAIAPGFGPFPFLVNDGVNGLLYRPDSITDLSRALSEVLGDSDLHEKLARGALATGAELRNPPMTFSQAVDAAFSGFAIDDVDRCRAMERSGEEQ